MYEFNIRPNDKEPTAEEIHEGFIHHLATLLNLYGAGKHLVSDIRKMGDRALTKEDVYLIMAKCCDRQDHLKTILSNCPSINVKK